MTCCFSCTELEETSYLWLELELSPQIVSSPSLIASGCLTEGGSTGVSSSSSSLIGSDVRTWGRTLCVCCSVDSDLSLIQFEKNVYKSTIATSHHHHNHHHHHHQQHNKQHNKKKNTNVRFTCWHALDF